MKKSILNFVFAFIVAFMAVGSPTDGLNLSSKQSLYEEINRSVSDKKLERPIKQSIVKEIDNALSERGTVYNDVALSQAEYVSQIETSHQLISIGSSFKQNNSPAFAINKLSSNAVKVGAMFSRDLNFDNKVLSSRMQLTKSSGESATSYILTNIYSLGSNVSISLEIDYTLGKVTIPYQKVEQVSEGDVMICAMQFTSSGATYSKSDVVGTINEKGEINLPGWGLIITEGANAGRGYNFFRSSEWIPSNAKVSAYDIVKSQEVSYECAIQQRTDNSLTFYGLSGVVSEIITGRISSSKEVAIPNSFVYTNSAYGEFYMYPYNASTDKAIVGADINGTFANGKITIPAWVIASRLYPTLYVGYKFKNITVSLEDIEINWPSPLSFNAEGDGTQEKPYLITSIEQMQALSASVDKGNTYEGCYFKLINDLDYANVASADFQPIGTLNKYFNGVFDGNNHTIKNLSVSDYSFVNLGLFGELGPKSKVSNLNISKFSLKSNGTFVGCIAGYSQGSIENVSVTSSSIVANCQMGAGIIGAGKGCYIRNCSFQGSIQGPGSVAGIAGQTINVEITGCAVRANIYCTGYYGSDCCDAAGIVGRGQKTRLLHCSASGVLQDTGGYAATGGLVGCLLDESTMKECFSVMAISAIGNSSMGGTDPIDCYQGGLIAYIFGNNEVRDCYSASYIAQISPLAAQFAAGLVGYIDVNYLYTTAAGCSITKIPHFYNCYYSGQVYSGLAEGHKNIFGFAYRASTWEGEDPQNIALHNCIYDNQISLTRGDTYGHNTDYFIKTLPEGFDASIWKSTERRYPELNYFAGNTASALSTAPLCLASNETAEKVTKTFSISPSQQVLWGIIDGDKLVQQNNVLAISGSEVTIKDQYATAIMQASSSDNWGLKIYRLGIVPKVFDGEGTAVDPYQLKSTSDFIKLGDAVSKYGQTHSGDYFKVMNDIDFEGQSFNGIGAGVNYSKFDGFFDGNAKSIKNLRIKGLILNGSDNVDSKNSMSYVGLFGVVGELAKISNIVIDESCQFEGYSYVGSIAGINYGKIDGCVNHSSVKSWNYFAGGIAGYSSTGTKIEGVQYEDPSITNCYNSGNVYGYNYNYGGIVGYTKLPVLVDKCQNDGQILGLSISSNSSNDVSYSLGGIVGNCNTGTVRNCVNNGFISGSHSVGGIVGTGASVAMNNCISTGLVVSTSNDSRRGAIMGSMSSTPRGTNNYYDASVNVNGAINSGNLNNLHGLSSQELSAGEFLEGLSEDIYDFTKGKYPVLKKFAAEPASEALRGMVAYFANGQIRSNVLTSVPLSESANWSLSKNKGFSIENKVLNVNFPGGVVLTDTLKAMCGNFLKEIPISAIPAILKGEGSETSPFLIETASDWNKLSDFMIESRYEYPNAYFKLTSDIDFQGDSIRLLAVNGVKFEGDFNGDGKTIKNFVYNNPNSSTSATSWKAPNLYKGTNIGLFGTIGSEGVVRNLNSEGIFQAVNNIGGIAGDVYGQLSNCAHLGVIETTGSANCSGVAYKVYVGGSIVKCINKGTVTSKTTDASGIVGSVAYGAVVDSCVNYGKIKSTSTGAYGIASTVAGKVNNCINRGILSGTGTAAGICGTLSNTGKLENCSNEIDINYSTLGSTVSGIANATTAVTAKNLSAPTTWIKNCRNTGNLTAKSIVSGITANLRKGVQLEDCYNTGNLSATSGHTVFGICGVINSNNSYDLIPTRMLRCWNSGDLSASTPISNAVCGLAKSTEQGAIIEDCYNIGHISVPALPTTGTQMTLGAGLIGTISGGKVIRCWNAGNVITAGPCVGGIAGYVAARDSITLVEDCFNLGDIKGGSILANGNQAISNGTSGGLFGFISTGSPIIRNCLNAGNVIGDKRVGGIAAGMMRPDAVVENCYNSGKVICDEDSWSGTIYTNSPEYVSGGVSTSYYANSKNIYYDCEVTPGTETRSFPDSPKKTSEMYNLNLGEGYVSAVGYPALKSYLNSENPRCREGINVATAMIALDPADTYLNIRKEFHLIGDKSLVWSCEGEGVVEIIEDKCYPRKLGSVKLTASNYDGSFSRTFSLEIKEVLSGIDQLKTDCKTVKSLLVIDMQGHILPSVPVGLPCIVKITYIDGTSETRKILN